MLAFSPCVVGSAALLCSQEQLIRAAAGTAPSLTIPQLADAERRALGTQPACGGTQLSVEMICTACGFEQVRCDRGGAPHASGLCAVSLLLPAVLLAIPRRILPRTRPQPVSTLPARSRGSPSLPPPSLAIAQADLAECRALIARYFERAFLPFAQREVLASGGPQPAQGPAPPTPCEPAAPRDKAYSPDNIEADPNQFAPISSA